MKSQFLLVCTLVSTLWTVTGELAYATGGSFSGGGDIACDAKIQDITANIRSWVQAHGPRSGEGLDLSTSVHPKTKSPYTIADYEGAMLSLLTKPVHANCVSSGDKGFPVKIRATEKICITTVDDKAIDIRCDRRLFDALSADDKIKQIHHELALHIPGLEPVDGPLSTYKVSQNLSAYIDNVVERRLVVNSSQIGSSREKCQDPIAQWYREQMRKNRKLAAVRSSAITNNLGSDRRSEADYSVISCSDLKVTEIGSETCSARQCGEMMQAKTYAIFETVEGNRGKTASILSQARRVEIDGGEIESNRVQIVLEQMRLYGL